MVLENGIQEQNNTNKYNFKKNLKEKQNKTQDRRQVYFYKFLGKL